MIHLAYSKFDWDAGNLAKCQKHGVSILEIETLFARGPQIAPNVRHSQSEERYVAVGRNTVGKALFVSFTFREREGQVLIRPVSARYMHRKEMKHYEKTGEET